MLTKEQIRNTLRKRLDPPNGDIPTFDLPEFTVVSYKKGSKYKDTMERIAAAEKASGYPLGSIWLKGGETLPKVMKPKEGRRAHWSKNLFKSSGDIRTSTMEGTDVMSPEDFVAEMAHEVQHDWGGANPNKKGGLQSNLKLGAQALGDLFKHRDKGRYDVRGTHEYQAHKVIEPRLWKTYRRRNKNQPWVGRVKLDVEKLMKGGKLFKGIKL